MKQRTVVAPVVESDFSKADGKLAFWKQILPQSVVNYTTKSGKRAVINFDEQYLTDLARAHANHVLDQTPFLLADADNRHTMDPERIRADVVEMRLAREGEAPGLYGKFVFPSQEAAKAVLDNPKLGVSARIREGIERSDGSFVKRGIIHVLGTLDPQVTGMAPWVPAVDLSFDPTDNILDLSDEAYEGAPVAKKKDGAPEADEIEVPDAEDVTDEQIDAMTDEELNAFLEKNAPGILAQIESEVDDADEDDENDDDESEEDESDEAEPKVLAGAGAELSNKAKQDIELANAASAAAQARANEALKRMAAAEWREYRATAQADGVPPHLLDLAEPILNRPEDMVVDLSVTDDDDVNASEIVRAFIDAARGTVDLSVEQGHTGSIGSDEDPDKDLLAMWDRTS